jgi:6-pyruvoyltetrahydropterin/6-carboxytetrahydropterin synthase
LSTPASGTLFLKIHNGQKAGDAVRSRAQCDWASPATDSHRVAQGNRRDNQKCPAWSRAHRNQQMFITRKAEFSASHVCRIEDWPDETNERVYGAAANRHGHGHNYILEVTLEGDPDPVTGMVIDLKELKNIIESEVLTPMDHRFLNFEVPPFDRLIPTTENVAAEIWRRLAPRFGDGRAKLHRVRLYETPDLYVDIATEDVEQ